MSRPAIILDDLDRNLSREEALALINCSLEELLRAAARRRDAAHGSIVSYSRKVFIPLTQLCRDVCHYCTFAHPPRKNERAYLSLEDVLAIARAGQAAGCKEPLNRCSIYKSKEAGRRLDAMLSLGLSKPWPEALEAITGQRQMDATAVLDYFAPLQKWLDEQNKGKPVGW